MQDTGGVVRGFDVADDLRRPGLALVYSPPSLEPPTGGSDREVKRSRVEGAWVVQ